MPSTAHRNSVRHSPFRPFRKHGEFSSLLIFLTTIITVPVHADGEINELITSSVAAIPSAVISDGITYQWGQGENLHIDGFFIGNDEYRPNLKANSVSVLRRDIPGVAIGELCGIFAERLGSTGNELETDFPALADHPDICDMPAMLMSSVINRGTLNIFTNTGANPNNIERIDYRFDDGILAPSNPDFLADVGHVIGEKHGNNRVHMAAILAKDESENPAQYGPLVSIGRVGTCSAGSICYGQTRLVHDYVFFKSRSLEPLRDLQEVARVREPVTFAFLSMKTLGIPAGSVYYGISVFPHDINITEQNLLDISSFPNDTEEPEISVSDSADIYGGSASVYMNRTVPGVSGRVFCQTGEGGTAPKPGVPISLFQDTVEDGVLDILQDELVADLPGTTNEGRYSFPALEKGTYFVVVSDRLDDDTARVTAAVDNSPVNDADIFLDEACTLVGVGPMAFPDAVTFRTSSVIIAVLSNDKNADGQLDAPELRILEVFDPDTESEFDTVFESDRATVQIQDRTVLYTPTADFRRTATEENPAIDTFRYTLIDDQDRTSETTVTVTILAGSDPSDCFEAGRTDCLFVETEVEGVGIGRIPPLACLLLLTFVVMRRYAVIATSTEDQS